MVEDRITPEVRLGIAKSYAYEFNNLYGDWRQQDEAMLTTGMLQHVAGSLPPETSMNELVIIRNIALVELRKMGPAQKAEESPRKPEDHPFPAPNPDEIWPD